jgi:hypothetical protein
MDDATKHPAARMPTKKTFFRYICDLPMQSDRAATNDGQRPRRKQIHHSQFSGYRLPTAQSLPVSPHREFGISHWQL